MKRRKESKRPGGEVHADASVVRSLVPGGWPVEPTETELDPQRDRLLRELLADPASVLRIIREAASGSPCRQTEADLLHLASATRLDGLRSALGFFAESIAAYPDLYLDARDRAFIEFLVRQAVQQCVNRE